MVTVMVKFVAELPAVTGFGETVQVATIRIPAMLKTQTLCLASVTNQGRAERREAIVAPSLSRTSSDGSAHQRSVPKEVNGDR